MILLRARRPASTSRHVVKKLRKFPTNAIPDGPTKIAKILDVIKPIIILINTLIPFKDVILNNGVLIMTLKKSN